MSFWKSQRGLCSDSWADTFDRMIDELSKDRPDHTQLYGEEPHEITLGELADLVSFCTRGHVSVTVEAETSALPLSQLGGDVIKTIANAGQPQGR